MANQLQIHRVKLKDSNVLVIYYYESINRTNFIHSLNVKQQFGLQVKKHYGLFLLQPIPFALPLHYKLKFCVNVKSSNSQIIYLQRISKAIQLHEPSLGFNLLRYRSKLVRHQFGKRVYPFNILVQGTNWSSSTMKCGGFIAIISLNNKLSV